MLKFCVKKVEELLGIPIRWVGVGADRDDLLEIK